MRGSSSSSLLGMSPQAAFAPAAATRAACTPATAHGAPKGGSLLPQAKAGPATSHQPSHGRPVPACLPCAAWAPPAQRSPPLIHPHPPCMPQVAALHPSPWGGLGRPLLRPAGHLCYGGLTGPRALAPCCCCCCRSASSSSASSLCSTCRLEGRSSGRCSQHSWMRRRSGSGQKGWPGGGRSGRSPTTATCRRGWGAGGRHGRESGGRKEGRGVEGRRVHMEGAQGVFPLARQAAAGWGRPRYGGTAETSCGTAPAATVRARRKRSSSSAQGPGRQSFQASTSVTGSLMAAQRCGVLDAGRWHTLCCPAVRVCVRRQTHAQHATGRTAWQHITLPCADLEADDSAAHAAPWLAPRDNLGHDHAQAVHVAAVCHLSVAKGQADGRHVCQRDAQYALARLPC